jgi:hypothetical protein
MAAKQKGSAKDIRDIKPVIRPDFGVPRWAWATVGLGAALLLIAGWRYHRWRKKKAMRSPPPPAHEVAYAALDALRATDFDSPEAVHRYYFAISGIVRQYLESRFGLNATDLTTREILARGRDVDSLTAEHHKLLATFLQGTDLVKFADHRPVETEIRACYDQALHFVRSTGC